MGADIRQHVVPLLAAALLAVIPIKTKPIQPGEKVGAHIYGSLEYGDPPLLTPVSESPSLDDNSSSVRPLIAASRSCWSASRIRKTGSRWWKSGFATDAATDRASSLV